MITLLPTLYLIAVATLSVYGLLGVLTLILFWRHRYDPVPPPPTRINYPAVTIQLPIYNERVVIGRLISAAVSLRYPADKLQIQVLDDSNDETTQHAAQLVSCYQRKGINITLLHRPHRQGYKAGALHAALPAASGEFIAIFDADFQPQPDFLLQTIPYFLQEPKLGMIQARWGHLNDKASPLTAAQAIALDKHFMMEQMVRHRANLFPKFNGAAGVWRRRCMEESGGWQVDTVCEDLCLSTRAILNGWQFRFLPHVVAPAELPASLAAYKNQQARWAKGSLQCLIKYGRSILLDSKQTILARLYALLSMSAYLTQPLVIALLLLQVPLITLDYRLSPNLFFFSIAGIGQPLLFIFAQRVLYADWRQRLRYFPTLILLAIGIGPSTSRALLQTAVSRHHPFIRTPKKGNGTISAYPSHFDWIILVELFCAGYAVAGIVLAILHKNPAPLFFLLTCALAFTYVAFLSLGELRKTPSKPSIFQKSQDFRRHNQYFE